MFKADRTVWNRRMTGGSVAAQMWHHANTRRAGSRRGPLPTGGIPRKPAAGNRAGAAAPRDRTPQGVQPMAVAGPSVPLPAWRQHDPLSTVRRPAIGSWADR